MKNRPIITLERIPSDRYGGHLMGTLVLVRSVADMPPTTDEILGWLAQAREILLRRPPGARTVVTARVSRLRLVGEQELSLSSPTDQREEAPPAQPI